jgi:hypothetical protein
MAGDEVNGTPTLAFDSISKSVITQEGLPHDFPRRGIAKAVKVAELPEKEIVAKAA